MNWGMSLEGKTSESWSRIYSPLQSQLHPHPGHGLHQDVEERTVQDWPGKRVQPWPAAASGPSRTPGSTCCSCSRPRTLMCTRCALPQSLRWWTCWWSTACSASHAGVATDEPGGYSSVTQAVVPKVWTATLTWSLTSAAPETQSELNTQGGNSLMAILT